MASWGFDTRAEATRHAMRRTRPCLLTVALLGGSVCVAGGALDPGSEYQQPSPGISALLDAPMTPSVLVAPGARWLAVLELPDTCHLELGSLSNKMYSLHFVHRNLDMKGLHFYTFRLGPKSILQNILRRYLLRICCNWDRSCWRLRSQGGRYLRVVRSLGSSWCMLQCFCCSLCSWG